ncbi:hypothetical protein K469DRAFT_713997 [Zopfia rhizophila CBS 207.26]|uniref:Uncharacterized protein n=1 Tax=Zopfia rhizophila CBS 207.26 TaxID=1314779 RepID=A0A6A6DQ51_9PEZI|nr:hypothetical protein K469DRAFT_713997 [Zopfia rhizophila CBS 207.26]
MLILIEPDMIQQETRANCHTSKQKDNQHPDGDFVKNFSVVDALCVILFAFWFCCTSTIAVLTGARRITFTLN